MTLRPFAALAAFLLSTTALQAQDFPQTFEHRFGTTLLEAKPERVVSLSYQNHDNLLALGVVPVGLRYWYGDYANGVWPWAQAALGDATPVQLKGDLNIEQIAALNPDVIEALWSGITQEEYDLLSAIAPVVASEAQYSEYGTPWDVIALTTGRIVGKAAEAEAQVGALKARMAEARAAHPNWEGATTAVAYYWNDSPGAYSADDIRPLLLSELGFVTPDPILKATAPGDYFVTISSEDLTPIDTDLLVWIVDAGSQANILALTLRTKMRAHLEGREVYADDMLSSAFSHASLLSLPVVLDTMLPLIEAAMDGDPATPVSTSVDAGFAPKG